MRDIQSRTGIPEFRGLYSLLWRGRVTEPEGDGRRRGDQMTLEMITLGGSGSTASGRPFGWRSKTM